MDKPLHIYTYNYDSNESELCKLESFHLFNKEEKHKLLFSPIKMEPSCSAFIKKRMDVMFKSDDYLLLIELIKKEKICVEGFKVEYLVLHGDQSEYRERLSKLKDIGYSIEGIPDYYHPTITYALCFYEDTWYFGVLHKDDFEWHKHKQKPNSYSNSISVKVAKALINFASFGNKDAKIIDACCGVGTIMLEACFSGYSIEGCEINEKIYNDARENLAHFNYSAHIFHSDIKDVHKKYDTAIVDLPYNLFSYADEQTHFEILKAVASISNRMVIASTSDISEILNALDLTIKDTCIVQKRRKANFSRKIWICEKR